MDGKKKDERIRIKGNPDAFRTENQIDQKGDFHK